MVGTEGTRLVVLRGNSASGKSSVAAGLRDRFGRGLALVGQDNLRRIVLRERDRPGVANIGLIDTVTRYALDAGYHVVLEGILYADHYGTMLAQLRADHLGATLMRISEIPQGRSSSPLGCAINEGPGPPARGSAAGVRRCGARPEETAVMELCAYCEALTFEPVPVAEEHGASGPGRIIYAHPEHAHLVQPDPRPIALLERIRARRGQS